MKCTVNLVKSATAPACYAGAYHATDDYQVDSSACDATVDSGPTQINGPAALAGEGVIFVRHVGIYLPANIDPRCTC